MQNITLPHSYIDLCWRCTQAETTVVGFCTEQLAGFTALSGSGYLAYTPYKIVALLSIQLAGCGPLRGPINPLAGHPVGWPRSAQPIEKYPNFHKKIAQNGPFNSNSNYFASLHLDFPISLISSPFNSNSNYFASPHLDFPSLMISNSFKSNSNSIFFLPGSLISQFCWFPTLSIQIYFFLTTP